MNVTLLANWISDPLVIKIIIALVGFVLIRAIANVIQRILSPHTTDLNTRFQVRRLITLGSYMVIALLITIVFNEYLGGLTVAFGVAGAGIAFALQEVIVSIAGWIAISFRNFYHVGDRVQLGGIKGDVIDIGMLRTTLMECGDWIGGDQYNGRIVRIANSFVFKEPVFNYSADFPFLWDEISVPVKYGSDYALARQILKDVVNDVIGEYAKTAKVTWRDMVKKYLIEDASVEPTVNVAANENWVAYTVRYVVDYKKRRSTKDRLFMRILEEFDKTEGRVSITTTAIQLVGAPPLDVRLKANSQQQN